jgi:hypothetical protein
MANELNRKFSGENVQKATKYMKRYSTSIATNEIQIKTTLRFSLPLSNWLSWESKINSGKDAGKKSPHALLVRI